MVLTMQATNTMTTDKREYKLCQYIAAHNLKAIPTGEGYLWATCEAIGQDNKVYEETVKIQADYQSVREWLGY